MKEHNSLCYRCDYRAQFCENGHAPRMECGEITQSKYSCYMYMPVIPVVQERNQSDKRPQFAGALFSARSHVTGLPEAGKDVYLDIKKYKNGNMIYWIPKERKNEKAKKKL